MTVTLGIDPGLSGGIAVFDGGELTHLYDMPTRAVRVKKGRKTVNRRRVHERNFNDIIIRHKPTLAVIEKVQGRHGDGPVGAFTFGFATGVLHGVLIANGCDVVEVTPACWKSAADLDADKDKSRQMAINLFPDKAQEFRLKKHDGRAEAAILGALKIAGEV